MRNRWKRGEFVLAVAILIGLGVAAFAAFVGFDVWLLSKGWKVEKKSSTASTSNIQSKSIEKKQ